MKISELNNKKIGSKDFKLYIYKNNLWNLSKEPISNKINLIIKTYIKKKSINFLIDENQKKFLKGSLNQEDLPMGKRIKILPNGKKIARGGFNLFAKNLKLNENKQLLWDIVYENSSGSKTYLYNEDKVELEHKKKAKIVDKFSRFYLEILKKLEKDIKNSDENIYLAIWTMVKTFIRVGNLEYYNQSKHKGLTTLQKKDIKIDDETKLVIFNFIGKDGVPQYIEKEFEDFYIIKLKKLLNSKQNNDFIFSDKNGKPIHSVLFSKILFKYTGEHFYPHIIRSFHADSLCNEFIKKNNKSTKKIVENKFSEIAKDLGHKKYNKKKEKWEINFQVTINNYIRPIYSKKMIKLYKKN